jgi:hypothetical protein
VCRSKRLPILANDDTTTHVITSVTQWDDRIELSQIKIPADHFIWVDAELPAAPACLEWKSAKDERDANPRHDGRCDFVLRTAE